MNAAPTPSMARAATQAPARGTVYYDGECSVCTGAAERLGPRLRRRGFELLPLQTPEAASALGVPEKHLLDEVRLRTPEGRTVGGADAIVLLARHVWWAIPLWIVSFIPGVRPILRRLYRWFVPYRYCIIGRCGRPSPLRHAVARIVTWAPAIALPAVVLMTRPLVPAWAFMWLMAAGIFYAAKWITWRDAPRALRARWTRSLGYLIAWPGMNAREFLDPIHPQQRPSAAQWRWAVTKMLLGAAVIWGVARFILPAHALAAGWIGMVGLIFLLHFGAFELIALIWQSAGVHARPIMDHAGGSTSVGEFWGRRWNRGFSDLSRRFAFDPLRRVLGGAGAMLATFAISGLLHEMVITLPAGAGWGGPTAYFLIQAMAILIERSRLGRRAGLTRGARGWMFMAAVTLAPIGLLFPPAFVERIILPFMHAVGAFDTFRPVHFDRASIIRLAALLHFAILIASALVPQVLDWRRELERLQPLTRHLVWVHGTFIVLVIAGFGLISLLSAPELAGASRLARLVCGFIALFWLIRLSLQFFLFDARPHLTSLPLKLGYHGLTAVFAVLVLAYSWCAIGI